MLGVDEGREGNAVEGAAEGDVGRDAVGFLALAGAEEATNGGMGGDVLGVVEPTAAWAGS